MSFSTADISWVEWDGSGFQPSNINNIVYHTTGHIDIYKDDVLRSLAVYVQREGVADGLGNAFKSILPFTVVHGYSGELFGGTEVSVCDENGETYYGDNVDLVVPTTWVEVLNIVG